MLRLMMAILLVVPCAVAVGGEGWQAGVARENITPTELMWMSGYGNRDHVAEEKLTDLWAKALVLKRCRRGCIGKCNARFGGDRSRYFAGRA